MGIALMENFDVADTATLLASGRGFLLDNGGLNGSWGLFTFVDKGVTRTCLRCYNDFNQGGAAGTYGAVLGIPIPLPAAGGTNKDREYYVSFRMRFVQGTTLAGMTPITDKPPFATNQMYLALSSYNALGLGQQYNVFNMARGDALAGGDPTKLVLIPGPTFNASVANKTLFNPGADGWFHMDIYKPKGDMTFTVWLNDFIYKASIATVDPNVINSDSNYLRLYLGRTGSWTGNRTGYEITDLIVIDPSTDGQKYRFGSSGRVLSLGYDSDVINEWVAAPGATLPHSQMMMIDKSVPDANNLLTALNIGQREQYGLQAVPTVFGQYVPALQFLPRVSNAGASVHTLAAEMDSGSGITEIGVKTVQPSAAYDTTPIIISAKPNGDPWTVADLAGVKVGFSVKS